MTAFKVKTDTLLSVTDTLLAAYAHTLVAYFY